MLEYDMIRQICSFLYDKCNLDPDYAIVLGSGLDAIKEVVEPVVEIPYQDIPYVPVSTVQSHAGSLMVGRINGRVVAMMRGRVHLYEGHTPAEVVRLLRALIIWGAGRVLLTNAAGGINPSFKPGDLMLIEDQINMQGVSSLTGFNDDRMGERFPDMSTLYCEDAYTDMMFVAKNLGIHLYRGVYAGMHGPAFETPAEINMLRVMGADVVGMSTVLEAEAAHHMGALVAGVTLVSNYAARKGGDKITHESVSAASREGGEKLIRILKEHIK